MKRNPRDKILSLATVTVRLSSQKIVEKYELSNNELMQILTETTYQLSRNLVREEHQSEE